MPACPLLYPYCLAQSYCLALRLLFAAMLESAGLLEDALREYSELEAAYLDSLQAC